MVGGGKSSSSSNSTSTSVQETVTPDISGVVTGDAIQGQNITINGLTPDKIGEAFSALINLTSHTIDAASEAGAAALAANTKVTTDVAAPTQSTLDKLSPIIGIVAVGGVLVAAWKAVKHG
jgi:hypothetical protein